MNYRRTCSNCLAGLFLCGAVAAQAQVTKSGSGYLLRMKFVPGQAMKYLMEANFTQSGRTLNIKIPILTTVKSVANGVGTLDSRIGPISMNGKAVGPPGPDGKPIGQVSRETMTRDSRGNVVAGKVGAGGVSNFSLPSSPIKTGGTWKNRTKITAGSAGEMEVDAVYRLVTLESVGGRQSARITVSLRGTGKAKVTGSGTMWIAVADGSLVKSTTSMQITINNQTVPMTTTMVRL